MNSDVNEFSKVPENPMDLHSSYQDDEGSFPAIGRAKENLRKPYYSNKLGKILSLLINSYQSYQFLFLPLKNEGKTVQTWHPSLSQNININLLIFDAFWNLF